MFWFTLATLLIPPAQAQVVTGTASSQVLERVDPVLPAGALGGADYDVSCKIIFHVGGDGLPTQVQVSGCASPFFEAAQTAAVQWRFLPSIVEGHPQPYIYSARISFERVSSGSLHHSFEAPDGGSGSGSSVRILNKVEPQLSPAERQSMRGSVQGETHVKLKLHVDGAGVVTDVTVVDVPEALRSAYVEAAYQWRFAPVLVEGRPTPFDYMWSTTWQAL